MFDIDLHLGRASRTFALAIPLLPEPTRSQVGLAYLIFRVADTLEDADAWPRDVRLRALDRFGELLAEEDLAATDAKARALSLEWLANPPTAEHGYLELLRALPELIAAVHAIEAGARKIVIDHARRTAKGMREVLARGDARGEIQVATLDDLRAYCYVVAGIVGELLTALFVHAAPSLKEAEVAMREHDVAFGEGLQLVNILKDEKVDREAGRSLLPKTTPRAQVIALARADLARARVYIDAMKRAAAPPGFLAFTTLPENLAQATLDGIERDGAGAKLSRPEVAAILARFLDANA